jgi:hypothetical protein
MQKHWDVMRSDDAGESWREVSGNLPTDFGFPIDVHAHEPETIYVVPIKSDSEHYRPRASCACTAAARRERVGGAHERACPQRDCYVNGCGMRCPSIRSIRAASTRHHRGQCTRRRTGANHWAPIVRDLPSVLSSRCRRWHDPRVRRHLRRTARVDGEVKLAWRSR